MFYGEIEKKICYEVLRTVTGFYNFYIKGKKFIILSGKLEGEAIDVDGNNDYKIVDFKTLDDLFDNNNNKYDYDKFIS